MYTWAGALLGGDTQGMEFELQRTSDQACERGRKNAGLPGE